MNKRIVRFACGIIDKNSKGVFSYGWTRGAITITTLCELISAFTDTSFKYRDILSAVNGCKENNRNYATDNMGNTFFVRRWSYHRKG